MLAVSSFDSLTDVGVTDASYGSTGDWAWTACADNAVYGGSEASFSRWCRSQDLVFNLSYKATKYFTLDKTRAIACHELGHTVGLRHDTTATCMKSPPTSPATGADYLYKTLLVHELTLLKANY